MKFKKEPALSILFRILTPEEIQELTSSSRTGNKTSLNSLLMDEIKHVEETGLLKHEDNILEFKGAKTTAEEANNANTGPETTEDASKQTLKGAALIIDLKTRMKESQNKLKEMEIKGLYKKLVNSGLSQDKTDEEDLKKSQNSGVLVNKRQF
jgi:hypothetical protein